MGTGIHVHIVYLNSQSQTSHSSLLWPPHPLHSRELRDSEQKQCHGNMDFSLSSLSEKKRKDDRNWHSWTPVTVQRPRSVLCTSSPGIRNAFCLIFAQVLRVRPHTCFAIAGLKSQGTHCAQKTRDGQRLAQWFSNLRIYQNHLTAC